MASENKKPKIVIVGAGLVGALNAVFFAQTGEFDVELCEKRTDIRNDDQVVGRSINLALSHRGRSALKAVGLEDEILKSALPMYARMIHEKNGKLKRIPYGKSDEFICAVDRKVLNELLITQAENSSNVRIRFNTKLIDVDFKKRIATFSCSGETVYLQYDLLVGNDGAYSSVRQSMQKIMRFDFSQEYIQHGYKELYFPPKENNTFQMEEKCLHIWPRNEFMLIALPNPGGSFTGTLFMPYDIFDTITTSDDLFKFFENNFPDALEMIGKSDLEKLFFSNSISTLVTIRCKPYNFQDSCVIMGDAAHAMIPFYGQGMNCGFEDLIIFHEILRKNNFQLQNTGSEFTDLRNDDAKAICELAFYNYIEMRKNVTSKVFHLRKTFDNLMNFLFPSFWIPLYTMVSFTRIPYTICIQERKKQDKILKTMRMVAWTATVTGLLFAIRKFIKSPMKI